ncbi:TNKS [Branchiostoma lanceolatum]|uniref:TNKS protein n=1 Tax=Branchiostoma lanceolatum TaxID=7740 RepID=A0A8J9YVQ1_BRALA|nr:TNKS [Branchiostoma lanceolatum]
MNDKKRELCAAAEHGFIERLQQLLDEGTNPDASGINLATPLHWVAGNGHTGAVQLLVTFGADPNKMDWQGFVPLHYAAHNDYTEVVQTLLIAGADPDTRDSSGITPVHSASYSGHARTVQALIQGGANPNEQDMQGGKTPEEVVGDPLGCREPVSLEDRKAVLKAFRECQHKQLAPRRITCNVIIPGFTKIEAWDPVVEELGAEQVDAYIGSCGMKRWASPREVGGVVAFLCSEKAAFITGVSLPVDGGVHLK